MNEQFANTYPMYGVNGWQQGYQQPTAAPVYNNPLGDEKIKELLARGNVGKEIKLTDSDVTKAICNHHYQNQSMLEELGNGKVRCRICNVEFTPVKDPEFAAVELATEKVLDIWESIKYYNSDIPINASEAYAGLAYIRKTPEVFKAALDSIDRYYPNGQQQQYGSNNPFATFAAILGGPQSYGYYQQPYQQNYMNMGMGYQPQPGFAPQPNAAMPFAGNQAAQMMQAAAPGSNGFGYTTVPTQQAPQQFMNQANMVPPTQQAPVGVPEPTPTVGAPTTTTGGINVNGQVTA